MRGGAIFCVSALLSACATVPASQPAAAPAERPFLKVPEVRITQEPGLRDFALEGAIMQGGGVIGTAPGGTTSLTFDGQPVAVDQEGRFFIAFDRDAGPVAKLSATLGDGRRIDKSLSVAKRAWAIQNVNVAKRPVADDAAFMAIRKPELEQIVAARAQVTGATGWRQRFVWPRTGRISGLFGAQRIYRGEPGAYHGGIDIAAGTGDAVRAPADGVVVLAADHPFSLEGNLLIIDHGAGLNSAFLHLSRIDVRPGDPVAKGQQIGAVGATGRATGPHLHWAMMWKGARIDPLLMTGPMPAE